MKPKQYWTCLDLTSVKPQPSSKNISKCHPPTLQADSQGPSMAQSQHRDRCFGTSHDTIRHLFPWYSSLTKRTLVPRRPCFPPHHSSSPSMQCNVLQGPSGSPRGRSRLRPSLLRPSLLIYALKYFSTC